MSPVEIWGWCPLCRRWFYCPTWFDRDQPSPRCQVCDGEPTAIENRAGDSTWSGQHCPTGWCAACGANWFEGDQSLAACPRCRATGPLRDLAG